MMRLVAWAARLLLAIVGLWLLVVTAIVLYGQRDEARPADAIVVLGAAQYDGRPSPVLRARLDHAIALHRDGIASWLIVTGGVGVGDTVSEAIVGQRYAIREGIPPARILTEPTGLRSAESLRVVARLMEEEGLESAILVSDPFHMLRLRILGARFGMRAYSSPTRTSPISRDRARELRHVLRESFVLPAAVLPDLE